MIEIFLSAWLSNWLGLQSYTKELLINEKLKYGNWIIVGIV